jgi:DNA-binding transcriptional LysR family regulator
MELRHLRYFVAVAEELHFGRAARRLGIAQPPLSQQIRKLEEELGAPLFVRASRRVQLTDIGRTFLDEARATLAASERAMRVAKRAIAGDLGRLHFGYVASAVMHAPFTTLMRRFRESHPDVDLVLDAMPTAQQVNALRERRIDAAFLRPPIEGDATDLTVLPMVREGFVAVLPAGHRLATRKTLDLGDLGGEPFVFFERARAPGLYDLIMRLLSRAGVEPVVRHEVNPMQTVAGLVAAGFGISVMPASIQRIDVHGVVYRSLPTKHVVDIAFTHRTDDDSPALRAFAAVAREIAKGKPRGS